MPKRTRRKTKVKKRTRKMVKRRKATRRKPANKLAMRREEIKRNKKAQWMAYRELQQKVDQAWENLRANVKRKAAPETIIKYRNALALLLGECNYMTRECMSLEAHSKKR